jgi:monoamine oxidase
MDCDLLIIGAGAAGIAAARAGLAAGRRVRVLEARNRVGGRALTETATLGAAFDLGATWLHSAERNPLVPLARGLGIALADSEALRQEITYVGGRPAMPGELAAYDAAEAAFEPAIRARAALPGPDIAAAEAAPHGGPWDATVAAWQGQVICAWPLSAMSLRPKAASGRCWCGWRRGCPSPAAPRWRGCAGAGGRRWRKAPSARCAPARWSAPCRPACSPAPRSASTRRCRRR